MSTPSAVAVSSAPASPRRAVPPSAGNLTATLVVVAAGELLVSRLIDRLFLTSLGPHIGRHPIWWARLCLGTGPFLTNLCGVLALGLFAGAVVGLIRRGELFPRALRITTGFISLFLIALSFQGLLAGHLSERTFAHLQISSGFLSLLIAIAVLGSAASRGAKTGFVLLVLPGLLQAASVFGESTTLLRARALSPPALMRAGEVALLLVGLVLPSLVRVKPRPLVVRPWTVGVASLCVAAYVVLSALRYDLVSTLALHGLHVELPEFVSFLGVVSVLSLAGFVWAVLQLWADKGPARLMAYGAVLVAIAGYQVVSPVEMSVGLVGQLAFAVGLARRAQAELPLLTLGGPRWRDFVAELASSAGDTSSPSETVIAEEAGREVSRIAARRGGYDVVLRLFRRGGALDEIVIEVGQPGHAEADASVARPTSWLSRGAGEQLKKPRLRTGDVAFDRRVVIHGELDVSDPSLRKKLQTSVEGVLFLWRGRAARYVAVPSRSEPGSFADVQALVGLLDLILELIESKPPSA
jgi:hypothetical protein